MRISVMPTGEPSSVDVQIREHGPAVGFRLARRDRMVGVRVESLEDSRRNTDSGRQIHVESEPIARHRHTRGLQIFIEDMCGRSPTRHQEKDDRCCQRFHRRAALTA